MILGGFLMLPATFDDDPKLRISKTTLGVIAVAILTLGFAMTALVSIATRSPSFRAESIYLPCATSSAVGLLTVFYHFLLSSRYVWHIAATATTVGAGVSSIVYVALLVWTNHKTSRMMNTPGISLEARHLRANSATALAGEEGGDTAYYQNYIQNMFPASYSQRTPSGGQDSSGVIYDEMQRQQMLMLLAQRDPMPSPASQNTFRIDWQDQEDAPPQQGYYAPLGNSEAAALAPQPSYRVANERLRPWDGVWRGSGPPRSTNGP